VDILIENSIVVESNGPDHFIYDADRKVHLPTLNSLFKAKMFKRMNKYKLVQLDLLTLQESPAHVAKRLLLEINDFTRK